MCVGVIDSGRGMSVVVALIGLTTPPLTMLAMQICSDFRSDSRFLVTAHEW